MTKRSAPQRPLVATGVGPFSGQAVHFRHLAPEKVPYVHNRYQYEAERHHGILDQRLATRPNVKRLVDEINARPAAVRAQALKDRFTFKTRMDDEARSHMFKHVRRQVA